MRSESYTIAVGKVTKVKPIDTKDLAHTSYFSFQKARENMKVEEPAPVPAVVEEEAPKAE